MRASIIYYSKTGRTRRVALYIRDKLVERGVDTRVHEVRPMRDYFGALLHINPRLIYDTLFRREVDITGVEDFDPKQQDLLFIGTPIWFGTITPPINTFIRRYRGLIRCPVVCFTTSGMRRGYEVKFRRILETLDYNVLACISVVRFEEDKRLIDKVIDETLRVLKK